MISRFRAFSKNEQGATMFEYAILVGVIALIAIGGAMLFGSNLTTMFHNEANAVANVNNSANTN
jgi:Flp pilus assembly pilin Flp